MTWTKLGSTDTIVAGRGKEFNVDGKRIAVFNVNGNYYATEALCRHQDGPLAEGTLRGETVECPWHFWHYNVRTGELLDYLKSVKLDTYNVEIRNKEIYVDV